VTVTGTGFLDQDAGTNVVTFGGVPGTGVTVMTDTTLTVSTPVHPPGLVDVVVTNNRGSATLMNAFTFIGVCRWDAVFGGSAGSGANSDDSSTLNSFGFTFPFYGVNQSSVYVGSNGYLTFGTGFGDFTWSGTTELSKTMIAPMYNDLRPNTSVGMVHFKTDSSTTAVITYDQIDEWPSGPANTFQVQIFSSGRFCMLWNGMNSTGNGGTIGVAISPGSGSQTNVDFSALSFTPVGSSEAIYEEFNSGFDLDSGVADFFPDGSGGYTVIFYALPP
ncbi:MAG: IPT/TIG domain-containing protein, partial [Planctomycetota bacterium]|jgi:hypothetical protein